MINDGAETKLARDLLIGTDVVEAKDEDDKDAEAFDCTVWTSSIAIGASAVPALLKVDSSAKLVVLVLALVLFAL
jgi:hypothetical protein